MRPSGGEGNRRAIAGAGAVARESGAGGRRRTERHAGPAAEGLHPRRQPAAATAPSRRRSFRLIVSPPV